MDTKYLKLARQAREENNTEDAKKFYDMARTEDPENVEAKFFYAYYNLADAIVRDVPNKYVDYTKVAVSSVKRLKESTLSDKEKLDLLEDIANTHAKEVVRVYHYVASHRDRSTSDHVDTNGYYDTFQVASVQSASIHSLEDMGNNVANLFGSEPKAMELAANLWKGIFSDKRFSREYFFQSGTTKEESAKKWHELVEKIQKTDSSFPTPEEPKAIGIQCGSK